MAPSCFTPSHEPTPLQVLKVVIPGPLSQGRSDPKKSWMPTVKGWSLGRRRHYAFWREELDGENPFCLSPSSLASISDLVPESASQMAEAEDQQPWGFAAAQRGRLGPAHKPRRGREWLRRRAGDGVWLGTSGALSAVKSATTILLER